MTGPAMLDPVPAAIDQLLVLLRGAPALEGVRIDDGPPIEEMDDGRAIGVGVEVADVGSTQVTSTYGYGGRTDQFDITCVAQVWSGDTDLAALRTAVHELLGVVRRLLELNRDLGGAVTWARIARRTYRPVQDRAGALALIEFTVRVDANRDHEG